MAFVCVKTVAIMRSIIISIIFCSIHVKYNNINVNIIIVVIIKSTILANSTIIIIYNNRRLYCSMSRTCMCKFLV